ncbi:hypothetical protein KP509_33G030400 [Ceratopteris richardii]|uniref:Peroxidase n=1 Tax=Ceratopteris richardii TaxID=49495 RepID=A0A8T2QQ47_CERRI|nr:hypothetical protein KP509_33G030400 [Ceratopteris richardii]
MRLNISSACMFIQALLLAQGAISEAQLTVDFYRSSCPNLQFIVRGTMQVAVMNETRIAASILRLFFHDCFVQGCDASVLLDDTPTMKGEKSAFPNANSLRGFDVIDIIKANVEAYCPGVVSCADILALASRDAVVLSGGPGWNVLLGRRDSLTASVSLAKSNLPAPTDDLNTLIQKFQAQGLSVQDLVTLSGAHTIGLARCTTFKNRLYNNGGSGMPDQTMNMAYLQQLQSICPSTGGDDNLALLDFMTPSRFDTLYYKNLLYQRGLLNSDQELYSSNDSSTSTIVSSYAQNWRLFYQNFATSMISMGNVNPLMGNSGSIRKNCRVVS